MNKPSPQNDDLHSTKTGGAVKNVQAADEDSRHAEIKKDIVQTSVAWSASETVFRFGNANAEFFKGYSGIDNETGKVFAKGLEVISQHKVNPDPIYTANNIKQQAGYSAEVAATSKDNAEAIIQNSKVRFSRSDDLACYGRNHTVVDRVQLLNGEIIAGSESQMKFMGDRETLFRRIAEENKQGKSDYSRYRGIKLELPSEQFEGAEQFCRDKANELRQRADVVQQNGNAAVADKLRREAANYDQLAGNVTDSGLTTEQAIFYREHPEIATALDIARTSHRAGMEGARYAAIIGGAISLLQNGLSIAQGNKDMSVAVKDVVFDSAKAAAIGYGTAFVGSAIKGGLQQCGNQTVRALAKTSAPTLALHVCLSLTRSIKRYVNDEITEAELLTEVGEKGAGMLSSGMMAALGQVVIPVPFVGAAIGGMIGYTLSSIFYQSALDAAKGAEMSRERLRRTKAIQEAARINIAEEQSRLDAFIGREMPQLQHETQKLFMALTVSNQCVDNISAVINEYATLLGKRLEFQSMNEFGNFMISDCTLSI